MKTKSISCCVWGIIFSIIGAICAYAFDVVVIFLVLAIKRDAFIMLIPYIHMGMYAVSFIGSIFSLFNAKLSGLIMIISSIINMLLLILLYFWLKQIHILILLFWLPALFVFIVSVKAIKKSKKQQLN